MHTPMTAPAPTSNFPQKEKHPNIQLVPMGTQPVILVGIVNIGTQDDEYQGKPTSANKIKFSFEFPNHRQLFYVDDTVPKPSMLTMTFIYSISKNKKNNKKSALLNFIESIFGPIPESEYLKFDISKMLGQMYFANVKHYFKKDGVTIAQKIDSVYPFNPAIIPPTSVHPRTNDLRIYDIQMGFECPAFASLYYFEREDIKNSREGKAHAAAGGLFVKLDENGNMIYENAGAAQAPAVPQKRLVMTNPATTAEQFRALGWTDDNMVLQGHARYEDVVQAPPAVPAPAPVFQQPVLPVNTAPVTNFAGQPIQQAVAPVVPAIPQVPQIPVVQVAQGLIMTNPAGPTYEQMIANSWTDELLIQHGHATRPAPVAPVVPAIPSVPAVPVVPAVPQVPTTPVIPQAPINPVDLFAQTPAAPVQNITAPVVETPAVPVAQPGVIQMPVVPQQAVTPVIPQAPPAPITAFETPVPLPTPVSNSNDEHDDLPF